MLKEKIEFLNKKVDEIALRTRLEIEGEHLKRIKCNKTLRFFVTFSDNKLIINTRVLNELYNDDKTNFWNIVKRVCVSCNTKITSEAQQFYTENFSFSNEKESKKVFEWNEKSGCEGFIVPVNQYKNIQILVKLKNERQVFKLSKVLREFLQKFTETKNGVIKDIYRYVNLKKLINYNTSEIKCDEELEKIFRLKSFNFVSINQLLEFHLQPIGYCVIDLEIGKDSIWDINMEIDDLSQFPVLYSDSIYQLERKIDENKALKLNIQEKIGVIEEFIEDPTLFINRKIALETDNIGLKTAFYDDISVQTALYELIKKQD